VEGEPVIWLHVSDDDGGVGCIAIRRQALQNWRRIYVRFGCMTRLNGRQQAEKSPQITLRRFQIRAAIEAWFIFRKSLIGLNFVIGVYYWDR
jgi:hypothetical protein